MGRCFRHPDRETAFRCLKHGVAMCEECLACRDPKLYCKFRSACPIGFIDRRRKRQRQEEERAAARAPLREPLEGAARSAQAPGSATLLEAGRPAAAGQMTCAAARERRS